MTHKLVQLVIKSKGKQLQIIVSEYKSTILTVCVLFFSFPGKPLVFFLDNSNVSLKNNPSINGHPVLSVCTWVCLC